MSVDWHDGQVPTTSEYLELRAACGLGSRTVAAAARGLAGGLHSVCARDGGVLVAMGRLVGDGGTAALVTDIAVHPAHRAHGHGRQVLHRLMAWARTELPASCYVSLIANPGTFALYRAEGFEIRTGMGRYM